MRKRIFLLWTKIFTALLALLGVSGCMLRSFSCVYGGPPEAYEREEVQDAGIKESMLESEEEQDTGFEDKR